MSSSVTAILLMTLVTALVWAQTNGAPSSGIQKRAAPDLYNGPETEFYQNRFNGAHMGRMLFNVKRDTSRLASPVYRSDSDIPSSSSGQKHKSEDSSAERYSSRSDEMKSVDSSRDSHGNPKRLPGDSMDQRPALTGHRTPK